ncbi:Por secretion system C-terminal sorting domain-containing protein [Saccharicrinis carchari]|uniref:Por secretion system C-terminal sorting domain-containing protein n=1 Tax=Saccharicrinis carchari TaxID=1168039 RepID=A0A521D389_SACCC|nr:T9SS type A sorting domain-containing protein [Saccharicrinis carchari]SMO65511.1 Por secretion system C-terminal sorting domain-containing protein [Saccharicrinis carchari]
MKYIYSLIIILGISLTAMAQLHVIGSAGGEAENITGSVSWTLGETFVNTTGGSNMQVTQGFQQGNFQVSTAIDKSEEWGIEIKVYPNPVKNLLTVETQQQSVKLRFRLYNVNGKLLKNGTVDASRQSINLSNYPPGNYIFQMLEASELIKSFNVVKQE